MNKTASPLANADFRKLFTAQVIALVGTGLTTVALTLLAYDIAGGDAGVVLGTALAFKMIAYVVFAPIVGGLAHRFPRKPLLISLDVIRAGIVLLMPFITSVWQIYLLIFLLNLFSAGFKPVFSATIPDVLPDEQQYTKALSYSRLAYDLETMLSPLFAGLALLLFSYSALFLVNSVAFLISAGLIFVCLIPQGEAPARSGSVWNEISFGLRAYMSTPRLRALLSLYVAVSAASAMVIVNTVVYVREYLGGSESNVAIAMAAAGTGSMIAAFTVPRILETVKDRVLMIGGAMLMGVAVAMLWLEPGYIVMLGIWAVVGFGLSLVQTPSGRVVNRSTGPSDRSAYFSAQFALSHACWLVAYPVAGQLGAAVGVPLTSLIMGITIFVFAGGAFILWPAVDGKSLSHKHEPMDHKHPHIHETHHDHPHEGWEGPEPHVHPHKHKPVKHAHPFVIDDHHGRWPSMR